MINLLLLIDDTTQEAGEDGTLNLKLFCFVVIFFSGFVGGLLPLKLKVNKEYLSFGNVISGGIFLAAGMTHMLKESIEGYEELRAENKWGPFPVPYFLCIVGILGTFFIEKISTPHSEMKHSHSFDMLDLTPEQSSESKRETNVNMYILALLLSVHSIIEGIALGIESHWEDTTKILIAIVSHKFFAAFALGVNLVKNKADSMKMTKMVVLFSSMTPFGILLGLTTLYTSPSSLLSVLIQAISSGTFIYIALVEVIVEEFQNHSNATMKFTLLSLGVLSMSLLSANEGHQH